MKRFKSAKDIRVGVIGYGGAFNMGRHHLAEMRLAGMTPAAVAEIDTSRLDVARADYPGIETYTSVSEMLKKSDVNLVTIITPHNTHAKLAMQCLNAKRHVVCEKPLAITTAECDAMIAAARKNSVMLSTYHNRHWDGCILRATDRIRAGAIGKVLRIHAHMGHYGKPGDWWRSSKSVSGGILYDWGVHLLEYSLQLIDAPIVEVSGFAHSGFWAPQTAWKQDTNEDEGFAVVRFATGQYLTLCISSIDSNARPFWLEVTGTEGAYSFNDFAYELIKRVQGERVALNGQNPPSEGHRLYQNIADHLVKGTKLIISAEWARRPIHILDLAAQSARKGAALKAKHR